MRIEETEYLQIREVLQWERPLSFYYNINDIRVVGAQSAE